ncbi:ROK family transcriptional regulator [Granulicella mallensis]|uniref:ROK family protein n=1 Tax=Granulicella mallensis (strain ATCC BAA-1857 / DSM 23137 / MP5ACTX8) TaxID=682795 RepID=G8NW56_GRAMM|nr:ROK family transcriptional regulator [Granulicella mallensis]AEU36568.1 ROK family protein [Granulicella mallensis MP5ACTX8]
MKKKSIPIGRPSVLRHANAHSILKLLRECGSCSRADLVRASNLSAPTITNVVKDLLAEGLVEPLGEGESSGGRPPDMIRFKAERGCLLAVEISAESISLLLTDLNGNELDTSKFSLLKQKTTPEAVCGYIGDELKALLKKQKKTREQLLALVVGVPAITNVEEGSVLSISTLEGWRSVPLRVMLTKIANCLVIVENDMNLAALGEHYCGTAQAEKNFVFINIGTNVGAGIFLGGRIHHGSQWSAGEIAYLRLPSISRRQPTIHEFGELEMVLTSSGILKSWQEETGKAARTGREIDAVGILNLAQAGDPRAEKIVLHRAEIVADIIVDLSLILNPGLILLGGEVGSHPALIDLVRKQLEGDEFAVTKVGSSAPGNRAVLWGAISLALDAIPGVLLPQPAL